MWTTHRIGSIALVSLAMIAVPVQAQSRPAGWHHHHHHGHSHWRFGFGIGFGWPMYPYGPHPGHVIVEPAPARMAPEAVAPSPPDPVFTPRSGQSATQTEADRQACNRFATTQPSAMADAGVFHHTVLACMESRGYSVR
jgi:hypothetical protein